MKVLYKPLVILLAVFITFWSSGCSDRPDKVVIGVALGVANHPAVRLAVDEINRAGGIKGVPLELTGMEWQIRQIAQASEILEWAERFAATPDLIAVIGHSDSASTLSGAAFYNQHRIPQIVTIATSPAITNVGSWTYRLCLSDAKQGPALARYAVQQWGKKRIATFYVNDDYGRGIAQMFEQEVRRLGGSIVSSVMHRNLLRADDRKLIQSTIERLHSEGQPELFALFQREEAALWTVEAIRRSGSKADILGGDTLGTVEFLKALPAEAHGIRFSQHFVPDPTNPRAAKFVADYERTVGDKPGYGQAFAYDAVYLIAEAVREAGFSREDVKSYLDRLIEEKHPIEGVGGTYTLGPDHDGRRDLYIAEIRDGGYEVLARLPVD
ncbi:MAG TPA: ABC transporter substrate-binding protein [Acidobacteriota bacterium]|nr:ABC transporter substrate-binding protein [Acidobacteriota bacterium]